MTKKCINCDFWAPEINDYGRCGKANSSAWNKVDETTTAVAMDEDAYEAFLVTYKDHYCSMFKKKINPH